MIDIKDLMASTAKLIDKNPGCEIDCNVETCHTEKGDIFYQVKFGSVLASIQHSFAAMVDCFLPIDIANRMAELCMRKAGRSFICIPRLTAIEEQELSRIQKFFEMKQNDFEKRIEAEKKVSMQLKQNLWDSIEEKLQN